MKGTPMKSSKFRLLCMIASLLILGSMASAQTIHDSLYVGDGGDNTVKRFDAVTGKYLGVFVTPGLPADNCLTEPNNPPPATQPLSCIFGPRGLIFNGDGDLLVVNQNAGRNPNGEVLRYDDDSGVFEGALVPSSDLNSPVAPRGIVLGDDDLFVASAEAEGPNDTGALRAFTKAGIFVAVLPAPTGFEFRPRGVVIGPDGLLYVSNCPNPPQVHPNDAQSLGGQILRYDPKNLSAAPEVFVAAQDPKEDFNRPEGLVFGPDGNLYVTSDAPDAFTATGTHTDRIQVFAGPNSKNPGSLIGHISLDEPSGLVQKRATAQALLFGKDGFLYVPIQGPLKGLGITVAGDSVGEVRRYNVQSKNYTIFYPSALNGGKLHEGWYLTFGKTNPATLAYGN
jgi:hypothetical protein